MLYTYYIGKKAEEKEKTYQNDYLHIYQQILEYYNFQKKIETFFSEGFNSNSSGKKEEFYFINSNWIINWKTYINYNEVIKYIDKNIDYLINKKIIKKNYNFYPGPVTSNNELKIFLGITLLKQRDFERVVNQKAYDLFKKFTKI